MRRSLFTYSLYIGIVVLFFLCSACSNSVESNDSTSYNGEEHLVKIIPELKQHSRAGLDDAISDFYVTGFAGRFVRGKNIHYSFNSNEWIADGSIVWPSGDGMINFYALSQPYLDGDGISNSKINSTNQYFTFTCDPDNPRDLLYSSALNTTESMMNGQVQLNFVYALAYPYFTCVQAIDDVTVNIKEIVVHNLESMGTFTFDKTMGSFGEWTEIDTAYATYRQVLETPVTLNPNQTTAVTISEKWKWIPQRPKKWTTTADNPVPITTADENHECYVELKCQIIKDGSYLWGAASGENEYESVYYPFGTNFNSQAYQRAIKLKFTGGYLSDGTPFKPHSGSGQFTIAEWITIDALVDPWEEMDPEDLIF